MVHRMQLSKVKSMSQINFTENSEFLGTLEVNLKFEIILKSTNNYKLKSKDLIWKYY